MGQYFRGDNLHVFDVANFRIAEELAHVMLPQDGELIALTMGTMNYIPNVHAH